jgi:hypothetical protein
LTFLLDLLSPDSKEIVNSHYTPPLNLLIYATTFYEEPFSLESQALLVYLGCQDWVWE